MGKKPTIKKIDEAIKKKESSKQWKIVEKVLMPDGKIQEFLQTGEEKTSDRRFDFLTLKEIKK